MSHIGRLPIEIPEKVKVTLSNGSLQVEGPLGKEQVCLHPCVEVVLKEKTIVIVKKEHTKEANIVHGMVRALVANAVQGTAKAFEKQLEIVGVGYRAEVKGNALKLNLGFSHVVDYPIPEGIKISVKDQTNLTVRGSNKELVGRVSSQIRSYRPPEPYKGKGVKYADEVIVKKAGKAAATAGGGGGTK